MFQRHLWSFVHTKEVCAVSDSTNDLQLQKQFHEMNISDPGCATLVKSTLCAVSLVDHVMMA